jgi:hypothetical protein
VELSGQTDHGAEVISVWIWVAIALVSLGVLVFGGISVYRSVKIE